jgi:hypothetical protein
MQFDPFPVVRFWQILGDFFSGVVCDTMNNLKPKNLLLQFVQGKSYIDRTIISPMICWTFSSFLINVDKYLFQILIAFNLLDYCFYTQGYFRE